MTLLSRIWKNDTVYQEPVCFSEDAFGAPLGGTLIYRPSRVLEAVSWDGQIRYEEGLDYQVSGSRILLTKQSRIPFLNRSVYIKPYTGQAETAWLRLPGGTEYAQIFPDIYRYQILVTYRHEERWEQPLLQDQSARLSRSFRLLNEGSEFHLVFYGDSITAGWEASGCDELAVDLMTLEDCHAVVNHPPYMPSWAELVTDALRRQFPNCPVHKYNRAAGGSTTGWGRLHAAALVPPCDPDLVVLGFGMNSLQDPPEQYVSEIRQIIQDIRRSHPLCEFLLLSPMVPNPEIAGFQNNALSDQQNALRDLAGREAGIALAEVHSLFLALMERGKEYLALTGNCINHPNDFSVRIYAQSILDTLGISCTDQRIDRSSDPP